MTPSQRVFVNTMSQYGRTMINMVLSLYTVRIVLGALGESDYGIYILIAGIVSMLSFVTNSLVTTTQRFVSYYQGKGELQSIKDVFNNSLIIHIAISLCIAISLIIVMPILFNGGLNIPSCRIEASMTVYKVIIIIVSLAFLTSPFRALLISHENIIYLSVVDIFDGILKLALAVIMTIVPYDKLILYAYIMLFIQAFNAVAIAGYCYLKYKECVFPQINRINKKYIKELMGFAGWSVYSTGCVLGRQQGVAILLNKAMGTIVNSAYGIAFQIASYTNFLSSSLINSMAPQIVKAEGTGEREKALWLSSTACKFMFFLISAICIPCMFEIDAILQWWLKKVPANASLFCVMVMSASMVDALTVGLGHINQAIGKIRDYSLIVNTPKFLTVLFIGIALHYGCDLFFIAIVFVVVELFSSILRIFVVKKTAGLEIQYFIKEIFVREIVPILLCILFCVLFTKFVHFNYRFSVTIILSIVLLALGVYKWGLSEKEEDILRKLFFAFRANIKRRFKRDERID